MNFTINVQITGLEGIADLLQKLIATNPVTVSAAPVAPVVIPSPTYNVVPQVAPQPVTQQVIPAQPQQQMTAVPVMQQPAPVQAPVAAVPTVGATYSAEQLAVAATQLMDAGRRQELISLLATFGVAALTELPKDYYGAFATQLRAMGARI